MRANPNVFYTDLKNIPYLLPFGQGIHENLRDMRTNESGLLLWEELCRGADRSALLQKLCDYYGAAPGEEALLSGDLDQFLSMLSAGGFLEADAGGCGNPILFPQFPTYRVAIGPLLCDLQLPASLYETRFAAFAASPDEACRSAEFTLHLSPCPPASHPCGAILVRSEEILIADCGAEYLFLPLRSRYLHELHVSKDGHSAVLYFQGSVGETGCEEEPDCQEELFSMIRFAFLVAAQKQDLCAVHSASILYDRKAWLFSGHSGAGKSTHTRLWQECFQTPFLNGDLNLLGIKNGQPVCYGLPWCGTSGICTPDCHPLGGIVFLRQAPYNRVSKLTPDREILSLTQRMITPSWTPAQVQKNLSLAEALTEKIRVFTLECTKEPEAAAVMRAAIDGEAIPDLRNH